MIGKPGVLQSTGSQRVRHDLATKYQQEGKDLRPWAVLPQGLRDWGCYAGQILTLQVPSLPDLFSVTCVFHLMHRRLSLRSSDSKGQERSLRPDCLLLLCSPEGCTEESPWGWARDKKAAGPQEGCLHAVATGRRPAGCWVLARLHRGAPDKAPRWAALQTTFSFALVILKKKKE